MNIMSWLAVISICLMGVAAIGLLTLGVISIVWEIFQQDFKISWATVLAICVIFIGVGLMLIIVIAAWFSIKSAVSV